MGEGSGVMLIKQETAKDYDAIYAVVKEAFLHAEHTDGNEHNLVSMLRKGRAYIPELSLTAEINGMIAGHIMFTQAAVGDVAVLALAPLSVLPAFQRQGVGTALIKEGHKAAKRLGYGYSIVLGSKKYYSRAGYRPADVFGIKAPFDVPRENFMALRLNENAGAVHGTMRYAEEFAII